MSVHSDETKRKKTSSARLSRRSSENKKRSSAQKRRRKPKVALSRTRVMVLCALITGICVSSLALCILMNVSESGIPSEKARSVRRQTEQIATEKPSVPKKTAELQKSAPVRSETGSHEAVRPSSGGNRSVPEVKKAEPPTVPANIPAEVPPSRAESVPAEKKNPVPEKKLPAANSVAQKNSESAPKKSVQENQNSAAVRLPADNPPLLASASGSSQNDFVQDTVPQNRFAIPPAENGATIVIVIDDAGRSVENMKRYASLPFPLTIAVLPKLSQSRLCAETAKQLGKEVLLHQPMQAENRSLNPGLGAVKADMGSYEIARVLKENIAELSPFISGMNNHEGSLITSDIIKIGAVLEVCAETGLYFLDSRTSAATKARQAALERDMVIFEKAGPYLDNEISREKMLERMYETIGYANRHGRAIVIGHVDKSVDILPELLAELYPYMKAAGYVFATPGMLR